MAEREALGDAVEVRRMNDLGLGEAASALGVFGLGQVAAAGGKADGFAGGGDFEPLGHGFFRFDAFGTSHKFQFNCKRAQNLRDYRLRGKRDFARFCRF
jgi:hypothetical protein